MKKVTIIGGGLSGLSLATELTQRNFAVEILEKDSILGGRASNIYDKKMHDPVPIGPHVFVNAYNNFFRFLDKIGAKHDISWEKRIFLEIIYRGAHYQVKISKLPAPLFMVPALAHYKYITLRDKISNLGMIVHMMASSYADLEKLDNATAYDYLRSHKVSRDAIDRFWRFFVLSMLNIPLELCSAAEFALLLKHWSQLEHRKFGFAKVGLGDLFVKKSHSYLLKKRAKIYLSASVQGMAVGSGRVKHLLVKKDGKIVKWPVDIVVSSLHPVDLRGVLPARVLNSFFFHRLKTFEGVPYISVNLWFDRKITRKKFWAMLTDKRRSRYLNTDFYDQSNIYNTRKAHSFITSNIIYSGPYHDFSDEEIVAKTVDELKEAFPGMRANLVHSQIHRIPYVIYAVRPGMRSHKLSQKTPFKNFYLTGDWTARDLTQCMEAAVRSGYKCAEQVLLDTLGKNVKICNDELL